jgi:hypothetical protein
MLGKHRHRGTLGSIEKNLRDVRKTLKNDVGIEKRFGRCQATSGKTLKKLCNVKKKLWNTKKMPRITRRGRSEPNKYFLLKT